jgi:hypothetical protein
MARLTMENVKKPNQIRIIEPVREVEVYR